MPSVKVPNEGFSDSYFSGHAARLLVQAWRNLLGGPGEPHVQVSPKLCEGLGRAGPGEDRSSPSASGLLEFILALIAKLVCLLVLLFTK